MKELISFYGKPEIKQQLLAQMHEHGRMDEIIRDIGYWNGKRGCALGCTVHSSNHFDIEKKYGIPFGIARAEDTIFETLDDEKIYKKWPIELIEAIPVGVCLDKTVLQYNLCQITDAKYGLILLYRDGSNTKDMLLQLEKVLRAEIAGEWAPEERKKEYKVLAYLAYRTDRADRADLAYRTYLAYRTDLADLADRAYLAYRAYLADLAYLADRAYRADLADLADRTYLADRADASRKKLLELLKAAA